MYFMGDKAGWCSVKDIAIGAGGLGSVPGLSNQMLSPTARRCCDVSFVTMLPKL